MIPGIDGTYTDLLQAFPPRPIKSEAEYAAVQARVDALVDKGELTADEADYLSLLGMLIERYEADHDPMPELRGVALVKTLMAAGDLRQRDLVEQQCKRRPQRNPALGTLTHALQGCAHQSVL